VVTRQLARLVDFYRAQIDLIWNWRRGRRQLLLRAAVSFVVAFVSLGVTAAILPGVTIDTPWALAAAVVVIGLLGALLRPVLLALVAPFSLVLLLVTALAFQVFTILAIVPLVPGVHVHNVLDATIAAITFAIINSLFTWLLSLDSDDSYYSMLVRRLVSRRPEATHTDKPGLVIVQVDGLSHSVLTQQINAGRVPNISRWLRDDTMRLTAWRTLLPSQTSASQAGIMFGTNDDIPAFRWWDKSTNSLFVSNHSGDAEALDARLTTLAKANGLEPLLARDGASIGNLLAGGAKHSYLTMSTMTDPSKGLGKSRSYLAFFVSPYGFVHAIVQGVAEMGKEVFQARRAAAAGIEPRMARGGIYPFLRALTNVVLRPITTSLVIEEMLLGRSVIYVTYTDYDEIAHHSGPQRAESLDALDGVDRVLGSILLAEDDAPRPYHLVVLSDHGQTLGATFRQRYGHTLDDVIEQLMGGADEVSAAVDELDEWHVVNAFASELTRARGAAGVTRRALASKTGRKLSAAGDAHAAKTAKSPAAQSDARSSADSEVQPEAESDKPDLVVCPSGNLALVYFPDIDGRADLETLNEKYPEMIDALANHPGIGLLMVRSSAHGPLVIGPTGVYHLDTDKVDKKNPLEPYGAYAAPSMKRLDQMPNCGDLVVISLLDPDTEQVAAFEELIGSHGGLGGPQTEPMLLHPFEWQLETDEIVGAPAVHQQLMNWLGRVEEKAGATADQVAKPPSTRISNRQRRRAAKATPRTKQQVPTA